MCLFACSAAPNHEEGAPASEAVTVPDGGEVAMRLGCPGCHQDEGGRTLAGRSKPPYGPNLTPDLATGVGAWTEAQLTRAIRAGIDDEGEMLCSAMPRFKDLSDDDARALVLYLNGLTAVRHEVPDSHCDD